MTEPFVKWVGSKRQILSELLHHVPTNFETYHEPMVGGGALFWALYRDGRLEGKRVHLSDTNPALIECYKAIRDDPERLIKSLEVFNQAYEEDSEDLYYRIRDAWNEGYTSPARFIFLKQTAFNGLWRQNKAGKVNMAWGKYERPKILDADRIRSCSQALQHVDLWLGDFVASEQRIQPGDLVYYDPPYWGRFDMYGPESFTHEQHVQLVKLCMELCERGTQVIYTNEDGLEMRAILDRWWLGARIQLVGSRRFINRDGQGREPVADMIVSGPAKESVTRWKMGSQGNLPFL